MVSRTHAMLASSTTFLLRAVSKADPGERHGGTLSFLDRIANSWKRNSIGKFWAWVFDWKLNFG